MTNSLIEKQIVIKLQQLNAQQQQQVLNFTKGLVNQDDQYNFKSETNLFSNSKTNNNGFILEKLEGLSDLLN